jgi:hypothetical protein
MSQTAIDVARFGGSIRLTARHSNGTTLEVVLTTGSKRGHTTRAVTDAAGHIVSITGGSWPLSGAEPEVATDSRDLIELAETELAGSSAR